MPAASGRRGTRRADQQRHPADARQAVKERTDGIEERCDVRADRCLDDHAAKGTGAHRSRPRADRGPRMTARRDTCSPEPAQHVVQRMGDESLARRAADGDDDAFTALYERYYGPLLGYAARSCWTPRTPMTRRRARWRTRCARCRAVTRTARCARGCTGSPTTRRSTSFAAARPHADAGATSARSSPFPGPRPPPSSARGSHSSSTTCARCPSASGARSSCASSAG